MREDGVGTLLRIFVDEVDRHDGRPLYDAIVTLLRERGISGATVFRGVEGFGAHRVLHVAGPFTLAPNRPILIEVVDTEEQISRILPEIEAMVGEGLITLERVEYRRYLP